MAKVCEHIVNTLLAILCTVPYVHDACYSSGKVSNSVPVWDQLQGKILATHTALQDNSMHDICIK